MKRPSETDEEPPSLSYAFTYGAGSDAMRLDVSAFDNGGAAYRGGNQSIRTAAASATRSPHNATSPRSSDWRGLSVREDPIGDENSSATAARSPSSARKEEGSPHGPQMSTSDSENHRPLPEPSQSAAVPSLGDGPHERPSVDDGPPQRGPDQAETAEQKDDVAQMEAKSETTEPSSGIDRLNATAQEPIVSCIIEMFTYEGKYRESDAFTKVRAIEDVPDEGDTEKKVLKLSPGDSSDMNQECAVVFSELRQIPRILRSALKKGTDTKQRRRVTFSDTMTVFVDGCLEAQVVALHSPEFNIAEACYMYEPPPEYQDCLPFEPPPDYRDPDGPRPLDSADGSARSSATSADIVQDNTPGALPQNPPDVVQDAQNQCSKDSSTKRVSKTTAVSEPAKSAAGKGRAARKETGQNGSVTIDEMARDLDFIDEDGNSEEDEALVSEDEMKAEVTNEVSSEDEEVQNLDSKKDQLFGDPNTEDFYATPVFVSELDDLENDLFGGGVENLMENGSQCQPTIVLSDSDQLTTPSASPLESLCDSDSSTSSQDTMILMTTEECERNEAHIKENMLRYESLRRQILGESDPADNVLFEDKDEESAVSVDELEKVTEELLHDLETNSFDENLEQELPETSSQIRRTLERNALRRSLQNSTAEIKRRSVDSVGRARSPVLLNDSLEEKLRWLTTMEEDEPSQDSSTETDAEEAQEEKYDKTPSLSVVGDTRTHSILAPVPIHPVRQAIPSQHPHLQSDRRFVTRMLVSSRPASLEGVNKVPTSQGMLLQSLVIPSNLREWKISRTLENKGCSPSEGVTLQLRRSDEAGEHAYQRTYHPKKGDQEALDELESFVQQDIERIERIRKRYSLTEDGDDPTFGFARRPSVRGIKPKFGSTTEILKQMQSQLQPPTVSSPQAGSDTWPFREPVGKRLSQPSASSPSGSILDGWIPTRLAFKDRPQLVRETRYGSVSDLVPHLRTVHGRESVCCLQLYSNTPQSTSPLSNAASKSAVQYAARPISSQPRQTLVQKDERGAPEGASSSPQVSTDSLYHALPSHNAPPTNEETKKEGVIYFAMNV